MKNVPENIKEKNTKKKNSEGRFSIPDSRNFSKPTLIKHDGIELKLDQWI